MKTWHWFLVIGILVVGLLLGGWINAKTDLFGFLGFTGAADLRAAGDKVRGLVDAVEARDQLYGELSDRYKRTVDEYENSLKRGRERADADAAELRKYAESLERQNRSLRDGIAANIKGEEAVTAGIRAIERIRGITTGIEESVRQLQQESGDSN